MSGTDYISIPRARLDARRNYGRKSNIGLAWLTKYGVSERINVCCHESRPFHSVRLTTMKGGSDYGVNMPRDKFAISAIPKPSAVFV